MLPLILMAVAVLAAVGLFIAAKKSESPGLGYGAIFATVVAIVLVVINIIQVLT